jgi:hypothetical protein
MKENPDHIIVKSNNLVFGTIDSRPKISIDGKKG